MGRRENPLKRHDTTHIHDNMMPEKIFTLNWHSTACARSSSFTWRATWLSLSCAAGLSRRESIRLTWVRDRRETSEMEMEFLRIAVLSRAQWNAPTIWRLNSFFSFAKANLRTLTLMRRFLRDCAILLTIMVLENEDIVICALRSCSIHSFPVVLPLWSDFNCCAVEAPIDDDVLLTSAEISSNFLFTLI